MEITYLGHASFLLKGKTTRVVCDPFSPEKTGLSMPKVEGQIVTISHDHGDHNNDMVVKGEPRVVQGPGEYEIKGVSIVGVRTYHDRQQGKKRGQNVVYGIDIDDIRIVHLGDLGHKLEKKQIDVLEGVDVLLVNVGGETANGPKRAWEVVKQLSPVIVIPMGYKTKDHSSRWSSKAGVDEFVAVSGLTAKRLKRLTLKKGELPEEMELIILDKKD